MFGLAILLGFNLLGLILNEMLGIPLPANIIGLILFTGSLYTGLIKLEWVESAAQFLTKHMMLFFIPFLVGTVSFFPLIGSQLIPLTVSFVISTFLVLGVTGWVTSRLAKNKRKEENQHGV